MSDATTTTPKSAPATRASKARVTPDYGKKPAFNAGGGLNVRVILFALVVLMPVALLGYTYWQAATTGGVRKLPDGYKLVDLRQMVSFPFDERTGTATDVPEQYRNLDGQKVQFDGEMFTDKVAAASINNFSLVYSRTECCFSGPPKIQHFVFSTAEPAVEFFSEPVTARGTLHVDITTAGGKVDQVFRMDVESVEPAS